MQLGEWIIAVVATLSILAFAGHIVALVFTPTGFRPRTPVWNRYGEEVGRMENPGFEETEDEHHS